MNQKISWSAAALAALPGLGQAIAFANTAVAPNVDIASTFVRVYAGLPGGYEQGSGTVVAVRPDASGPGGWIAVLTADHVIRTGQVAGGFTSIEFGDSSASGPVFDSSTGIAVNVMRGPMYDSTHRVDLALVGVQVANMSTLPAMNTPFIGTPRIGSHISNVSGFGQTATLDAANRRYLVSAGTFGTIHTAFAHWVETEIHTVEDYRYESVKYVTEFGPTDHSLPAIDGPAHTLLGDSGGCSWSMETATWTLNGVHSSTRIGSVGGVSVVTEGLDFHDVRTASYSEWIRDGVPAVVPEPCSLLATAVGFAGLVGRRRIKKSQNV